MSAVTSDTDCVLVTRHDVEGGAILEIVINRPKEPILSPEEPWELEGDVPNVVFTCGTAELGGDYLVYYGGADKVIALARGNKQELIDFALNGE